VSDFDPIGGVANLSSTVRDCPNAAHASVMKRHPRNTIALRFIDVPLSDLARKSIARHPHGMTENAV
jgi:hypothetical protein